MDRGNGNVVSSGEAGGASGSIGAQALAEPNTFQDVKRRWAESRSGNRRRGRAVSFPRGGQHGHRQWWRKVAVNLLRAGRRRGVSVGARAVLNGPGRGRVLGIGRL